MDTLTKVIIVVIIIIVIQSWITHKHPLYRFSLLKENLHPGTILLPLRGDKQKGQQDQQQYNDQQGQQEMFLEITTLPKYGDDYLHITMTPSNLLNQLLFIVKGYKDNVMKGNIGYLLRLFSPVFNINLLYDQQMYFYLKDPYNNIIKPQFAKLYNNGKQLLLEIYTTVNK